MTAADDVKEIKSELRSLTEETRRNTRAIFGGNGVDGLRAEVDAVTVAIRRATWVIAVFGGVVCYDVYQRTHQATAVHEIRAHVSEMTQIESKMNACLERLVAEVEKARR